MVTSLPWADVAVCGVLSYPSHIVAGLPFFAIFSELGGDRECGRTLRDGHGACSPYGTTENPHLSLALVLTRSKRLRPLLLAHARAALSAAIAV